VIRGHSATARLAILREAQRSRLRLTGALRSRDGRTELSQGTDGFLTLRRGILVRWQLWFFLAAPWKPR
jgi:hypothetical protein